MYKRQIICCTHQSYAQKGKITAEEKLQIDSLFLEFEAQTGPGLAFGLLKDGEIIYTRNIGLADIENNTPITSQTSFQLGDLSRHFTAYAALLLEKEGKLSLQDRVSNYLPDLKIPASIKVIDLLRHSSGLHNFHTIKTLAGWYHERPYNQSDVLDIIQLQEELRFNSGSDYNYNETNLILLAEVVKKVSGLDFGTFMKNQVFAPLDMNHTAYRNDSLPLDNVAKGYVLEDGVHKHIELHNHTLGVSNLYSSVQDILKWEWNMMHPKPKDIKIFEKIKSIVQLESGREFSDPRGKLMLGQHFTHKERGITSDYFTSRMGPYTTAMFNFPDHDLVGVVLGNDNAPYNGYLVMLSAYILLEDQFTEPTVAIIDSKNAPVLSNQQLEKYTGTYYDPEFSLIREIALSNDTLRYVRPNGIQSPLISIGQDQFQLHIRSDDKIIIEFKNENRQFRMDYIVGESEAIPLFRIYPDNVETNSFHSLTGTYLSKNLGIAYTISLQNDQLVIQSPINGTSDLRPLDDDLFATSLYFMGSLKFERNPDNEVDGFLIKHHGAWNVWFEKIS